MVVFLAQMAQPNVLQPFRGVIDQRLRTIRIRKMSVWTHNPHFQMRRISSSLQHFRVVVRLDDEVVRLPDHLPHFFGNVADIGHQTKDNSLALNPKTDVLNAVVRHGKRHNVERAKRERNARLEAAHVSRRNLVAHTIIIIDSRVDTLRRKNVQVRFHTVFPDRFHVVGVVVGDEHVLHQRRRNAIFAKILFQRPRANSVVDNQTLVFRVK